MREPAPPIGPAETIAALFAGAVQPARRGFGFSAITVERELAAVVTRDVAATPFHTLVEFGRPDVGTLPSILIVPPLSAGGRISTDLFGGEVYLDDVAILDACFAARLAEMAEETRERDGWKWVQASDDSSPWAIANDLDAVVQAPTAISASETAAPAPERPAGHGGSADSRRRVERKATAATQIAP